MNKSNMSKKTSSKAEQKPLTKKQVRQMIRSTLGNEQELKFYISGDSTVTTDYAGFVGDASGMSLGDTDITRDGDRITLKEFDFRWEAVVGDSYNLVRCIIFQWRQDSGTVAPTPGLILNLIGDVRSPLSTFVVDHDKVIAVLYDKTLVVDTYHPVRTDSVVIKKFPDHTIAYQSSGTNGISKIFKLFISDSAAATHPTVSSYGQLRFTDS